METEEKMAEEREKGKWMNTKEDGVLLFKNISFSIAEDEKEEK
jgi:hypothetical protein